MSGNNSDNDPQVASNTGTALRPYKSSDSDDDLYCFERPLPSPTVFASCEKKKNNWNVATYHLRRAIGYQCPREIQWMKTLVALDRRGTHYEAAAANWACKTYDNKMEDLLYRATSIDMLDSYRAWKINCDECISTI
ncbi:hypothetical protein ALC62_12882 [Cyphomyrmex costatus]|uniref:Uncharacterized protein n=1 Tax=Cyphomyrmex costatus TaxID=456900 RepID=A0A151IAH3_9HYME|nr:hypothetical protein ALC62_12882 [Cyphomyrmex costatus]